MTQREEMIGRGDFGIFYSMACMFKCMVSYGCDMYGGKEAVLDIVKPNMWTLMKLCKGVIVGRQS